MIGLIEKAILIVFFIFIIIFSILMKRLSYTQRIDDLKKQLNMIFNYLADAIIELEEGDVKKCMSRLDSIRNYVPELNRIIEDKRSEKAEK